MPGPRAFRVGVFWGLFGAAFVGIWGAGAGAILAAVWGALGGGVAGATTGFLGGFRAGDRALVAVGLASLGVIGGLVVGAIVGGLVGWMAAALAGAGIFGVASVLVDMAKQAWEVGDRT